MYLKSIFLKGLSIIFCPLYCTQERTVGKGGSCPRFTPVLPGRLFSLHVSVDVIHE